MGNDQEDFVAPAMFQLPTPSSDQELTPLDLVMPRVYGTRWILCFPLLSEADTKQVLVSPFTPYDDPVRRPIDMSLLISSQIREFARGVGAHYPCHPMDRREHCECFMVAILAQADIVRHLADWNRCNKGLREGSGSGQDQVQIVASSQGGVAIWSVLSSEQDNVAHSLTISTAARIWPMTCRRMPT